MEVEQKAQCPNCDKEIEDSFKFCPECGYHISQDGYLYHYTSMESLYAILENIEHNPPKDAQSNSADYYTFKLWATHWAFLNDPTEYNLFNDEILKRCNESDEKEKQKILANLRYFENGPGLPYVISLSKNKDNLDMWRCYANNGAGVIVVLDESTIKVHIKNKLNGSCSLKQIQYIKPLEGNLFGVNVVDDDIALLAKELEQQLKNNKIKIDLLVPIIENSISAKHYCYMNEAEYRIVKKVFSNKEIKFRMSNGIMVPYVDVNLPASAIKEIIIGPCANSLNIASIREKCKIALHPDIEIKVYQSELPYRQLK